MPVSWGFCHDLKRRNMSCTSPGSKILFLSDLIENLISYWRIYETVSELSNDNGPSMLIGLVSRFATCMLHEALVP